MVINGKHRKAEKQPQREEGSFSLEMHGADFNGRHTQIETAG